MDDYKKDIIRKIEEVKYDTSFRIDLNQNGIPTGYLSPVDIEPSTIDLLKEWREQSQSAFPDVFNVTVQGTKKWLENLVMEREDRLLFMVKDNTGSPVGHLGYSSFDYSNKSCEIDNVIRGVDEPKGIMTAALQGILPWGISELSLDRVTLRVFSDLDKAVDLYSRCGFEKIDEIPMKRVEYEDRISFEESKEMNNPDRVYAVMDLNKIYWSSDEGE